MAEGGNVLVSEELSPRAVAELLAAARDQVVEVACRRVSDGRTFVRRNAALALSLLDPIDATALDKLAIARKDEDPVVRRHAISGFAPSSVPSERALPVLIRALDDEDEGVVHLASDGLERHLLRAGARVYKLAIHLLAESSFAILIRATDVFKAIGERTLVPLAASIAHPNGFMRRWARETLQGFGAAAVPVLIDALKRPHLRDAAARTLEGMDAFEQDHVGRLAQLSGGDDPDTQAVAFRVLTHVHKVFARRRQRLADVPHPEFYARQLGAAQLAHATEGVTAQALLWNLRDGRWHVRANSLRLMALVVQDGDSRRSLASGVLPLARDAEWRVRYAVAESARAILGDRAIPILVETAGDAKRDVAVQARRELEELAKQATAPLVRALEAAEDSAALHHAVGALVSAGKQAVPALREAVCEARTAIGRAGAVEALVALEARGAGERKALVAALTDEDDRVRFAAASALGRLVRGDQVVLSALRARLSAETVKPVRRAIAKAADLVVGKVPKPKTLTPAPMPAPRFGDELLTREALAPHLDALGIDALRPLFVDGRAVVRHNAAVALSLDESLSGDEDVVRWLLVSLKDGEEVVRVAAARAIGRLKPPPSTTVPALSAALAKASGAFELALVDAHVAYGRGALGPMLEALATRLHMGPEAVSAIAERVPSALDEPLARHLFRPASYSVRQLAADLLAAKGPAAAGVWPLLAEAVEDPLGRLRVKVVKAIGCCAEPSVSVYEALLIVGNYDARASVKAAIEEATERLVRRLDPKVLRASGGVEGHKLAWLRQIEVMAGP